MIESRSYHSLHLDIARAEGNRIVYVLLPTGLKADAAKWIEGASGKYGINIVLMSQIDWNDSMTPWEADGVFKKEKPFGGRANRFLKALKDDYCYQIESDLGIRKAERTLVGISLSGLFAIWAACKSDIFTNIVSISGSLWYDGFATWMETAQPSGKLNKIFISLGARECNTKEKRMQSVVNDTNAIVETLKSKGVDVDYRLESGVTHFSPSTPRMEAAMAAIFQEPAPETSESPAD